MCICFHHQFSTFLLLSAIAGCESWRFCWILHRNSDMNLVELCVRASILEVVMLPLQFFSLQGEQYVVSLQQAGEQVLQ